MLSPRDHAILRLFDLADDSDAVPQRAWVALEHALRGMATRVEPDQVNDVAMLARQARRAADRATVEDAEGLLWSIRPGADPIAAAVAIANRPRIPTGPDSPVAVISRHPLADLPKSDDTLN